MMLYLDVQNVYNFKVRQRPNLIRDEGTPPFVDDDGIERYELRELENRIGNVLPSIGIIIIF